MQDRDYPYPSRRNLVYGYDGMVATGNALAASVGMEMLKQGGNAIDAAIATAYTLTIVEPSANGLGGDMFAIVDMNGERVGLSSHGHAPELLTLDLLAARGHSEMPIYGVLPVTVPGMVAGLSALWRRFATLGYETLVSPAIRYAIDGYALQPNATDAFNRAASKYREALPDFPELSSWFKSFAPQDEHFAEGERITFPAAASALESIAASEGRSFYHGDIADAIDRFMREYDGCLRKSDLQSFEPEWVTPLQTDYKGHTIYEIPPSGQGITVLMALNTLKETGVTSHTSIEALKLALSHVMRHVADDMAFDLDDLLTAYPKKAAELIGEEAVEPEAVDLLQGGTVYLATADRFGNMVSLIQSNYMGFGSGVVEPTFGISLHNRACNFSVDPASRNAVAPGKRPLQTIIPGFIEKKGEFKGPFGIMGGFMQAQAHVQVLLSLIEDGLNPQAALDRPRWQWKGKKDIIVEPGFDKQVIEDLKARGHEIAIEKNVNEFGRGQIILRREDGLLIGACEPRTDSLVIPW